MSLGSSSFSWKWVEQDGFGATAWKCNFYFQNRIINQYHFESKNQELKKQIIIDFNPKLHRYYCKNLLGSDSKSLSVISSYTKDGRREVCVWFGDLVHETLRFFHSSTWQVAISDVYVCRCSPICKKKVSTCIL
jgi:hypothetical protein